MNHRHPHRHPHGGLRRLPAGLLGLALTVLSLGLSGTTAQAAEPLAKDETVYGFLQTDGALREIRVVNRLIAPDAGMVSDPGNYLSVRAMVAAPDPELSAGRVTWDLTGMDGRDFYYEGVMKSALPVKVNAVWTLDGVAADASTLSGADGKVSLTLTLTPDETLPSALRDDYLTQIQVPVDLDRVSLGEAQGAVRTVVGHTATLAWTLMPGESGTFSFSGEAHDFALDPILLSMVRYSIPDKMDVDALTDGVDKLADGAAELADGADGLAAGSTELADGLSSLKDGIHAFRGGIGRLSGGVADLSDGIAAYAAGFDRFGTGLTQAATGFEPLLAGFGDLRASSGQMLSGITALQTGLADLSAGHAQLVRLATGLLTASDPMVQQLAGGVVAEQAAIDRIREGLGQQVEGFRLFDAGLGQAIEGLGQATGGIASLPGALTDLHAGLARLAEGARTLQSGAARSAEGAVTLDEQTAPLPEGARKLADGQTAVADGQHELADGLASMREQTQALTGGDADTVHPVISFADRHTEIHSLQYVIQLPGIDPKKAPEPEGPRDVRLPWYEEFWNRLTGLFGSGS